MCNSHVISKDASLIILVQIIQKLHSHSLMLKQSTVYRCRNLKQFSEFNFVTNFSTSKNIKCFLFTNYKCLLCRMLIVQSTIMYIKTTTLNKFINSVQRPNLGDQSHCPLADAQLKPEQGSVWTCPRHK